MENTFWHKQSSKKPLFPDLLWSRPENKKQAGKLVIVGGNAHGFLDVAEAYNQSFLAGAGTVRAIMPDSLKKLVGGLIENVEFVPSTPSGSFSRKALVEILESAKWAETLLLAGDFGRNSETAILLESLLEKTGLPVIATKDAADYLIKMPAAKLNRPNTILVITIAQLQKLANAQKASKPITFSMGLIQLVDWLHEFTGATDIRIITYHQSNLLVAVNGRVSTTPMELKEQDKWRVKTASYVSVWAMQNPKKSFEALSTAAHVVAGGRGGT